MQLEFRYGDARPFELRNYAIDFDTLDEVNSSDDSTYRVEMLSKNRSVAAVNDNDKSAWPTRPFRFAMEAA